MRLVNILLFIIFTVHFAAGQEFDHSTTDQIAEFEKKAFKSSVANNLTNLNTPIYRKYFDVTKQSIDVQVTPGIRFIEGVITTEFEVLEAGYSEIILNCHDSLRVSSAKLGGNAVNYSQENDLLNIKIESVFEINKKYVLELKYGGIPPQTRAFSTDTNIYGDSALWTLSEPYGAKDWWPCKQDLQDKIEDLELSVTVPKKYKVAANGLLQSIDPIGTAQLKYTWKHQYPIVTYLVAFAVADYVVVNEQLQLEEGPLNFVNYIYPQDTAEALADLKDFKNTMNLFEKLFGPYPFRNEQYGHAQFGWGGGMEHQTMSFMVNFKHGLVAHELAHQWFGDLVTCGTWKDLWLNESFATYSDGLTYDFLFNEGAWENWKNINIDAITRAGEGSVNIPDTSDVDRMFNARLTYRKGAYLLHMLRYKMGDDAFFKAIRDYLQDEKHNYGFARTNDLIWHLKANGGYKIDEFFNDWFYAQGFPTYELQWHQTAQGKLHLVLNQEQSYIWEGVFFDMEVPIRILDDVTDTTIVFDHTESGQEKILDWELPVRVVFLDPDRWVLKSKESKVTNLDYENEEVAYKIAPNPLQNELNLRFSKAILPELDVTIYDLMGNIVFQEKVITGLSDKSLTINTASFANGAYTLTIQDYWKRTSLKFIKAKGN